MKQPDKKEKSGIIAMGVIWQILIAQLILLSSCGFYRQMQDAAIKSNLYSVSSGIYIKDQNTGLCFFMIQAYQGASIAQVPCDSLKNVFVRNIYISRK